MNTDSIKNILILNFGFKEKYSKEELDKITNISINRFDISGDICEVDYKDILNFKNLISITIKDCMISEELINILSSLNKLESVNILNCEIIDNPNLLFNNDNIRNLSIDNTIFDLDLLKDHAFNTVTLENINIDKYFYICTDVLDIKKCNISDYEFLDGDIKTLIVSELQYKNSYILQSYNNHMVIMEENLEFVLKEVNK